MAVDNIIEELEREGNKKTKSKRTKTESSRSRNDGGKSEGGLFSLAIVVVVILGIIGIVFGYTKDKLGEIKQGGNEATKGLEEQLQSLKTELVNLKQKTATLEAENQNNKEVVIDLFDKERKLPEKIVTTDWNILRDASLSFTLSYPKTWETVKAVVQTDKAADKNTDTVYLQPIGQANFVNAITIKKDYLDFAALKMSEKEDLFKELQALDRQDFAGGKMIYFVNLDKDNKEIPTILILTDKAIYKATFNISDKALANYFVYRKDFEELVSTFTLAAKTETPEKKP